MNTDLLLTKLRNLIELQRQCQGSIDAAALASMKSMSGGDYANFADELTDWCDTLDAQVRAESTLELAKTSFLRWLWEEDHFELGVKMIWQTIDSDGLEHMLRHPHHLDELAEIYRAQGL